MRDLRIVGRSEDGESLELHDLDGNAFTLRITDHLKSLVNQPLSYALRSVPSHDNGEISIKEIQSRLRGGESMESIAETGNVSIEKVERYSHPILQERSYIISLAQKAELKKLKMSLLDVVAEKLTPRGVEMKSCEWNTYRNDDGSWQVLLEYPTRDGEGHAAWRFESVKRRIESDDEGARWILGEESVTAEASIRPIRSQEAPPRLVSIRSTPTVAPVSPIVDEETDEESIDELELEIDVESQDQIPSDARRDGVTRKVSIPSWDDIMFGVRKDDPSTSH